MCWRALKQIKIAEHHFLNGVTRVLCGESNSAPRVTDFFDPLQTGVLRATREPTRNYPDFCPNAYVPDTELNHYRHATNMHKGQS